MVITLQGPTKEQIGVIGEDSLIIISKGSWDLYWKLSHEDLKVEFIKDRIFIQSPASLTHEKIFRNLMLTLGSFIKEHHLGELLGSRFTITLSDGKRVEPDLVFLSIEDINKGELSDTIFKGKPSLVIEIVSPNYREHDTKEKLSEYVELNVDEYWIVDPEYKTFEVVNFKQNIEIRREIISKDTIIPRLKGFTDFILDTKEFWENLE